MLEIALELTPKVSTAINLVDFEIGWLEGQVRRWIIRLVLVGVVGIIGFGGYDSYRAGYFSLPDLPDGAYSLSFENGLRAIVLDANVSNNNRADAPKVFRRLADANPDRKYLGVPFDVQPWFEEAWSWCKSPTEQEKQELERLPDDFKRSVENARFEAVCRIDVDGAEVVRGLIFSVPRL